MISESIQKVLTNSPSPLKIGLTQEETGVRGSLIRLSRLSVTG